MNYPHLAGLNGCGGKRDAGGSEGKSHEQEEQELSRATCELNYWVFYMRHFSHLHSLIGRSMHYNSQLQV